MSLPIRVCVLTVSDRCSQGQAEDASGPAVVRLICEKLSAEVVATAVVPDEVDQIQQKLRGWAMGELRPDLIVTTGGTGLSPRDFTPEATAAVLERHHPGLLELARLRCYTTTKTPRVFLSRGSAGTIGQTMILNLPGSPRGAAETLEALLDVLPHAIETLRGEDRRHGG
jgi:molybdenum cofactor synthesis domain-containing protein